MIDDDDEDEDRAEGVDLPPVAVLELRGAELEHRAPVGLGRANAESEEAQGGEERIASATENVATVTMLLIELGKTCDG